MKALLLFEKMGLSSLILGEEPYPFTFKLVDIPWTADIKQGYEHFMLKEIYEQKKVIQDTVYKYHAQEGAVLAADGSDCSAD